MEESRFRLRDCHTLWFGCPADSAIFFLVHSTGHPHAALQHRLNGLGFSEFARRYYRNLF